MGVQSSSAMPGVAGEAVQSYNSGTTGSSTGYSAIMPPPQPPQQQQSYSQHMETSAQATSRYIKPEEAHSPTRHSHQSLGVQNASPPTLTSAPHNPILPRHRIHDNSPTSAAATIKTSPLSLSSITSPFHPDQQQQIQSQSKNYHAQTLMLGERLRPGSEDPVIILLLTIPTIQKFLTWTTAFLRQILHPLITAAKPVLHHAESVTLLRVPSSSRRPETTATDLE